MADYYDRVEAQLAQLTERGAYRHLRTSPRAFSGVTVRYLAVAASALVVVAVGAVFLSAGTTHRLPRHVAGGANAPATIRNFSPATAPSGLLVTSTDLTPANGGKSPTGKAAVYDKPPNRYELSITASRLTPTRPGDVYAVWLSQIVDTASGTYHPHAPELVGLISPSLERDGKLAAESLVPQDANGGAYEILITMQPAGSTKAPGRTVLRGILHGLVVF
jgi:hypothetical protein